MKANPKAPKREPTLQGKPKPARKLGTFAGQVITPEDFDAPLPDEILDAFEGKDPSEEK
jgi:hypothetical protein